MVSYGFDTKYSLCVTITEHANQTMQLLGVDSLKLIVLCEPLQNHVCIHRVMPDRGELGANTYKKKSKARMAWAEAESQNPFGKFPWNRKVS